MSEIGFDPGEVTMTATRDRTPGVGVLYEVTWCCCWEGRHGFFCGHMAGFVGAIRERYRTARFRFKDFPTADTEVIA